MPILRTLQSIFIMACIALPASALADDTEQSIIAISNHSNFDNKYDKSSTNFDTKNDDNFELPVSFNEVLYLDFANISVKDMLPIFAQFTNTQIIAAPEVQEFSTRVEHKNGINAKTAFNAYLLQLNLDYKMLSPDIIYIHPNDEYHQCIMDKTIALYQDTISSSYATASRNETISLDLENANFFRSVSAINYVTEHEISVDKNLILKYWGNKRKDKIIDLSVKNTNLNHVLLIMSLQSEFYFHYLSDGTIEFYDLNRMPLCQSDFE